MVSAVEALAVQLPDSALTPEELARNPFFARFWASPDRIGVWVDDDDPPGERADEVARRLLTFARSLTDTLTRDHAATSAPPIRARCGRC